MNSRIAQNLYSEFMNEMRQRGAGKIHAAFERQEKSIMEWIDRSVNQSGVDVTVDALEDIATMDQHYEGRMPHFANVIEARNELAEKSIDRTSRDFRYQVRMMGERDLMDAFSHDEKGNAMNIGNPYADQTDGGQQGNPLEQILKHHQTELKQAIRLDDQDMVESYTRNVQLIEKQLEREQPQQPQQPAIDNREFVESVRTAFGLTGENQDTKTDEEI